MNIQNLNRLSIAVLTTIVTPCVIAAGCVSVPMNLDPPNSNVFAYKIQKYNAKAVACRPSGGVRTMTLPAIAEIKGGQCSQEKVLTDRATDGCSGGCCTRQKKYSRRPVTSTINATRASTVRKFVTIIFIAT